MIVYCEECAIHGRRTRLGRHNPYFYRQDGIKRCIPCRQGSWTPELPGPPVRGRMMERPTVVAQQRDEKTVNALRPESCSCPSPIPVPDEEGDASCAKCGRAMGTVAA